MQVRSEKIRRDESQRPRIPPDSVPRRVPVAKDGSRVTEVPRVLVPGVSHSSPDERDPKIIALLKQQQTQIGKMRKIFESFSLAIAKMDGQLGSERAALLALEIKFLRYVPNDHKGVAQGRLWTFSQRCL